MSTAAGNSSSVEIYFPPDPDPAKTQLVKLMQEINIRSWEDSRGEVGYNPRRLSDYLMGSVARLKVIHKYNQEQPDSTVQHH